MYQGRRLSNQLQLMGQPVVMFIYHRRSVGRRPSADRYSYFIFEAQHDGMLYHFMTIDLGEATVTTDEGASIDSSILNLVVNLAEP